MRQRKTSSMIKRKLNVFLYSSQYLYMNGLSRLLAESKEFQVKYLSKDWVDMLRLVKHKKPDVIVIPLDIPQIIRQFVFSSIRNLSPNSKILLISEPGNDESIIQALIDGAHGYVLNTAKGRDLIKAIKGVVKGEIWTQRGLMRGVINHLKNNSSLVLQQKLTQRDRDVALLLIEGFSDKEIANRLKCRVPTVRSHLLHLFKYFGTNNRTSTIIKLLSLSKEKLNRLINFNDSIKIENLDKSTS